MIFSALLATFLQVVITFIVLVALLVMLILLFLMAEEAWLRISARLRSRRCWREVEVAYRDLALDEHAAGHTRVGVSQREHVAGYRRSA
jgi:hypothetical protein